MMRLLLQKKLEILQIVDWKDYDTKMREAYDFEQKHLDIPFVKEINDCIKSYKDRYCLYSLCHYYTHSWVASLQQLGQEKVKNKYKEFLIIIIIFVRKLG